MGETILVTGGAGYIGSHAVVELLVRGYNVVVVDNYCNSSPRVCPRIREILAGYGGAAGSMEVVEGDIADLSLIRKILVTRGVDAVIHFAGLKAVAESTREPLTYYRNNVCGTLSLCTAMEEAGVRRLVFSSSATVYGEGADPPYRELVPRGRTQNPYGTGKAMVEQVLTDLHSATGDWAIVLLRYFNPIGAHPSGLIGEDPRGIPNNLLPYLSQVAVGRLAELSIFGNDYPTEDGTCKRDYLHVVDLAEGHVMALTLLDEPAVQVINLGTGQPRSVLEIVHAFEQATGKSIPYRFAPRRAGDLPAFWADPRKAREVLGWQFSRSLGDMMEDTWRWQRNNPRGYEN